VDWAWEIVANALEDLGVPEDSIEVRGSTARFLWADQVSTFVTIDPGPGGLDLFGLVRVEVTSTAGEGVEYEVALDTLLELNQTSAVGRWVWFRDGVLSRRLSCLGDAVSLSWLRTTLPLLLRLSTADAIRGQRMSDGRWGWATSAERGVVSQTEALAWFADLVGAKQAGSLPLRRAAALEAERRRAAGEPDWFSAGGTWEFSEVPFADLADDGSPPELVPSGISPHGQAPPTAAVTTFESMQNPAFGVGSLLAIELPRALPESFGWSGLQVLHALSGSQPVQELGAWGVGPDGGVRYGAFLPSGLSGRLGDEEQLALARLAVRDVEAQVRLAVRVLGEMDTHSPDTGGDPIVIPIAHRAREAHRLLGREEEPHEWGTDTVAYLADKMLQIDDEWSIRRQREVVWLPHHQQQWIRASAPFEDAGIAISTVSVETTVASALPESPTDARMNDLNCGTALATFVRVEDDGVVIHSSIPIHEQNRWWMPRWLADLAVLHLVESDDLAVDASQEKLPGWTASVYEMRGRPREEPDEIISAIGVLRRRSEEWSELYDEAMLTFLGEKLGAVSAAGPTTAESVYEAVKAGLTGSEPVARSVEGQWRRKGSTYSLDWRPSEEWPPLHVTVELDVEHAFLGPSVRVAVAETTPPEVSLTDVARWNSARARSPIGLWIPLVAINGRLAATTLVPACFVAGVRSDDRVSGWLSNVVSSGLRALRWAAEHP
jgi:hypothetical protein